MKRNEIRTAINEYLQSNRIFALRKSVADGIKELLNANYSSEQNGNEYKIECEYDDFFKQITGSIERCDSFETARVIDCVHFEIDANLEVMAYDGECFSLTLDMDNLSKDDLIDLKHISDRRHRIDVYTTFMRVSPVNRGKLAEKIENCSECFDHDIPPYAFYKYNGQFLHTTNRTVGDLGGGIGFGGNIREYGDIADISASIVSIGEHAFDGCTNLREIYLRGKIYYIGKHAFSNIPGLIIHCHDSSKPSRWDNEWCDENCKVIWNQ